MRLEWSLTPLHCLLLTLLLLLLLLGEVITHTADLQEALAVAGCDLRAIVVELAIINVVLMLGVDWECGCARVSSLRISTTPGDGSRTSWRRGAKSRRATSALLSSKVVHHLFFTSFRVKRTQLKLQNNNQLD